MPTIVSNIAPTVYKKKVKLFKPFLICCADGYIVDCYGPFPATMNDAAILDYIIETDRDLEKLLVPNKTTIILDRGKRCEYWNILMEQIIIIFILRRFSRFYQELAI